MSNGINRLISTEKTFYNFALSQDIHVTVATLLSMHVWKTYRYRSLAPDPNALKVTPEILCAKTCFIFDG